MEFAVNTTQDELHLQPDNNPRGHDETVGANLPVEGVTFPEDPIKLLSVQVEL